MSARTHKIAFAPMMTRTVLQEDPVGNSLSFNLLHLSHLEFGLDVHHCSERQEEVGRGLGNTHPLVKRETELCWFSLNEKTLWYDAWGSA
jgi:hypothetical protein